MAEVCVAGVADGFDALQEGRAVEAASDDAGRDGLGEGRPASAGFEFLRSVEEQSVAADTGIETGLEDAAHFGAEGAFGAGLAGYLILSGSQLAAPFGVGFGDFAGGGGIAVSCEGEDVGPGQHTFMLMPEGSDVVASKRMFWNLAALYVTFDG